MTPERLRADKGVGVAAVLAARLAMGVSIGLAGWGAVEVAQGWTTQPDTHEYVSTSDSGYLQQRTEAASTFFDGVGKLGTGAVFFLASWVVGIYAAGHRDES